ncbi:MAG TPA: glycosyltransferase [Acidimicrobiales bacterium]|nr:glycosyltransferase [Acidimicrobiales bacterium]
MSVIVPAYNEAHRLQDAFERFRFAVRAGAVDLDRTEVIVVDDGSDDDTSGRARSLIADFPHHRVIRLPANQGKGAAVRAGIREARGASTAYMDADMAIDPRAIPLLLQQLETNEAAIGSRSLPDSMVESRYMIRLLMGRLFNRLVTAGTDLDFLDTQCGFKAFHTEVARLVFHLVPIDRFAFDVEVLACAHRLGLAIAEVPVHWKHVPGSSVQPLHDSITMLADVFSSRIGLRRSSAVPAVSISGHRSSGSPSTDSVSSGSVSSGSRSSGSVSYGSPFRPGGADRHTAGCQCIEQVGAALAGAGCLVPLPVVTGRTETLVLFPLVDRADASDYVGSLHAALPDHTVAQRSLSLSDLLAFGPLAGRIRSSVCTDFPSTGRSYA